MRRHSVHAVLLLVCMSFCSSAPQAQTATEAPGTSLLPGPKPPDVPLQWKKLVGIYDYYGYQRPAKEAIILEEHQNLFLASRMNTAVRTQIHVAQGGVLIPDTNGRVYLYDERRDANGTVISFAYQVENYVRMDAGADPTHFDHIKLTTPVSELREKGLAAKPPVEPGPFRKPDLVELEPLDPAIHLDIRYAQSNNFLGTPVYAQARAFLQRPAAEALLRVLHKLQPLGYGLLIHDGYRPWYVTKIFWDTTPPEDHNFVADPQKGSRHNRGCAVDLTLYDLTTGKPVEMPGLYDEMSPRSFPDFPGGTSLQRWRRDLLRRALESEGFTVNEDEWWHFDYKAWKQYPILNVPFEELQMGSGGSTPQ